MFKKNFKTVQENVSTKERGIRYESHFDGCYLNLCMSLLLVVGRGRQLLLQIFHHLILLQEQIFQCFDLWHTRWCQMSIDNLLHFTREQYRTQQESHTWLRSALFSHRKFTTSACVSPPFLCLPDPLLFGRWCCCFLRACCSFLTLATARICSTKTFA